jgi:hypothetical protein
MTANIEQCLQTENLFNPALEEYSVLIEKACATRSDSPSYKLQIIPRYARYATQSLIDFVLKTGLFTRGRRREVIVLAALKIVFAVLSFDDLVERAKIRFGITVTITQLVNAIEDIQILKRDYKTARFRKTRLTQEDRKLLTLLSASKSQKMR